MTYQRRTLILLLTAMLTMMGLSLSVAAQGDMGEIRRLSYFIASDDNGVKQVYQLLLDGERQPRRITNAESDVLTFGVAYDSLAIAYISDGQLWLQSTHTESAEVLAEVTPDQYFYPPVWSQNGDYIAYSDLGVWLVNLATRETRQILTNVPLVGMAENAAESRSYYPEVFVLGADGKEAQLVVDIGVWEANASGIYDLATDTLQELDWENHSHVLPLYGDRMLVYGNGGVRGEMSVNFADSLTDINTNREVVRFTDLTERTLYAERATELHPGLVRVYGTGFWPEMEGQHAFYLDIDLMAGTTGEVNFVQTSTDMRTSVSIGQLSADGLLLPIYEDAQWSEFGALSGTFKLVDITTNEVFPANLPATLSNFTWQP